MAARRVISSTYTVLDRDVFAWAELECGHETAITRNVPEVPAGTTVECAACDRQAEAERSAGGSTRGGGTCHVC